MSGAARPPAGGTAGGLQPPPAAATATGPQCAHADGPGPVPVPVREHGRARRTDVVIIGAGHSGLAMSRALSLRSIDHVVLERGEVANAWRTERWETLRLLTPNWMCRLPGQAYDGDQPDGYMDAAEVAGFIARYAGHVRAPVLTHTTVRRVAPAAQDGHGCLGSLGPHAPHGWVVETDAGGWGCRAVVLASGACSRPLVPRLAAEVPASVAQCTAMSYRRPSDLDPGGVLVVGASATGLQLAHEIRRSGRRVLLATGEHVRMPRLYRGRDVQWWLLASGVLDQRIESMDDPQRARRLPSPQLVGSKHGEARTTLDLNAVQQAGVELCGRLAGLRGNRALFSGSLRNVCALADLKMNRMLEAFDAWAAEQGLDAEVGAVQRFAPTAVAAAPRIGAELGREVCTIVWATGYRPDFGWLDAPVFDRPGELRHDRGVVAAPGLYVLGLPFLRRRKSSFIHGAEDDVSELALHLAGHLDGVARSTMPMGGAVGMPGAAAAGPR